MVRVRDFGIQSCSAPVHNNIVIHNDGIAERFRRIVKPPWDWAAMAITQEHIRRVNGGQSKMERKGSNRVFLIHNSPYRTYLSSSDLGIEAPKIDVEREARQTPAYRFPTGIISLIKLYIISNVSPKVTRLCIFLFTLASSFSHALLCLRFEECE